MLVPGDLCAPSPKSLGLLLDSSTFFGKKTKIFSQRPKSSKKSMDLVHNIRCHKRGKSPKSSEHTYLHYTTLQYITLHYIHYITLHYIHAQDLVHKIVCHQRGQSPTASEHTYLPYLTLHYITLHYITSQYSTVHYSTLRYITYMHRCTKLYVTRGA